MQHENQPTEFVAKLYRMLENPAYASIVRWSETNDSFIILDIRAFQEQVIPSEFNHSNFSSFVRQLNKYDFHKQRSNNKEWEFKHSDFVPGNRGRAHVIKRKTVSRGNAAVQESIEELQGQLTDIYARMEKLELENGRLLDILENQQKYINMLMSAAESGPMGAPASKICLAMGQGEIRDAFINILHALNYDVDCTESGVEALQLIKTGAYKMVILEPILSQMSGGDSTSHIRAYMGPNFPVIVTETAECTDIAALELTYKSKGATAILWQPFVKSQLVDLVQGLLGRA